MTTGGDNARAGSVLGKRLLTTKRYGEGMAVEDREQASASLAGADRLLADAASAERGARDRFRFAATDLFQPDRSRLRDVHRVTMLQLLDKLTRTIEDELRQWLIEPLAASGVPEAEAALASRQVEIARPILRRSDMLRDTELVATLLRRAEEHRIVTALRLAAARSAGTDSEPSPPVLDRLLHSGDPSVAAAAMGLIIADSRRFDRFHEPVLARTDLPAELQHRLVWRVAAALRVYLTTTHRLLPVIADRALATAVAHMLAGYDEGETLEGRAMLLARRLDEIGALGDDLIADAVADGAVAFAVAALSARAGIEFAPTWDMAVDAEGSRLMVLLRAIGMNRKAAADVALHIASAGGSEAEEAVAERIEAFDMLDHADAQELVRPWRLDSVYRQAITELAAGEPG